MNETDPLPPVRRGGLPAANSTGLIPTLVVALGLAAVNSAHADSAHAAIGLTPRPHVVTVAHQAAVAAPQLGPRVAPVTVDFFFDPTSTVNRRPHVMLLELAARHPARLRIVFRVVGRRAQVLLPEAALEAHTQGRFFEFLAQLYANRRSLQRTRVLELAESAGVDPRGVEAAWNSGRFADVLTENMAMRDRTGARALPLITLNGAAIDRSATNIGLEELEGYYDDAYAKAKQLSAEGVSLGRIYSAAREGLRTSAAPLFVRPGAVDGDTPAPSEPLRAPPPLLSHPVNLSDLPARGADDARLILAVACSVTSRNCARLYRAIDGIAAANEGEVRLVFVPFFDTSQEPLRVLHEALMCAEEQDGYWRFLEDTLGAVHNSSARGLAVARLLDAASASADLDAEALLSCISNGRHAKRLLDRNDELRRSGVTVSPSLLLGGRAYPGGTYDPAALQRLIDRELQPGLLESRWPRWMEVAPSSHTDM